MMAGALAAGGFWAADQWKEKLEDVYKRQPLVRAERKFSKIDLFLAGGLDRIEEGRAVSSGIFFGRCEYGKRILEGRSGSGFFHSGRSLLRRFSFPGGKHLSLIHI